MSQQKTTVEIGNIQFDPLFPLFQWGNMGGNMGENIGGNGELTPFSNGDIWTSTHLFMGGLTLAALFLLLFSLYGLIFHIRGSLLRLGGACALFLFLLNPVYIAEERQNLANITYILIDDSPSQHLPYRVVQTEKALENLTEKLQNTDPNMQIKPRYLSEILGQNSGFPEQRQEQEQAQAQSVSNLPSNHETDAHETLLFQALDQMILEAPQDQIAGIFILSDGNIHDTYLYKGQNHETASRPLPSEGTKAPISSSTSAPQTLSHASYPFPIHILLTGQQGDFDLALEIVDMPEYGLVGETVTLTFQVTAQAILPPQQQANLPQHVPVTLYMDGKAPRQETVRVNQQHQFSIPLTHRGPVRLSLGMPPKEGELTARNNFVSAQVNAIRDRLKVLLVSGVPHQGERVWRNLLKSDPAVDLVHFSILRPPEKQDNTPISELSLIAFPTQTLFQDQLDDFDLVIFDRYRRRGVLPSLYMNNIVEFVRNGGAFLEISGPSYASPFGLYRSALGDILTGEPTGAVINRPFKPQVTDLGLRHPVTARLPLGPIISTKDTTRWGRWHQQVIVHANDGDTIMTGVEGAPLLTLKREEKGRIAQLHSDQIWLWAKGFEGGGPYGELIRRLSHWLMQEPDLEENRLSARIRHDQLHIQLHSLHPHSGAVKITGPLSHLATSGTTDSHNVTDHVTVQDQAHAFTQEISLKERPNGVYVGQASLPMAGVYEISTENTKGLSHRILAFHEQVGQEWQWILSDFSSLAAPSAEILTDQFETPFLGALHFLGREITLPDMRMISPNYTRDRWAADPHQSALALIGHPLTQDRNQNAEISAYFPQVKWMGLRKNQASRIENIRKTPLLTGGLALLAILGLIFWIWRREAK